MFMSLAKASARFGKTPGIQPGAKFTLPKSPTSVLHSNHPTATQRRQASVRLTLTKFRPELPPLIGHSEWLFHAEEIRLFGSLKDRLPADFWQTLLSEAAKDKPLTAGHAPDAANPLIYRGWRVMGSFGSEYTNMQVKALPWQTPHSTDETTFEVDLGDFGPDLLAVLFDVVRQQPAWHYSDKGREGTPPAHLWNDEDWIFYMKNHVPPPGSPHCIDFVAQCLERVAERLAPGDDVLLHFKQDLGYARQPQDVAAVLKAYFRYDEKRRPSMVSLSPTVEWPSTHIRVQPEAPATKPPQTKVEQSPPGEDDDDWISDGPIKMRVPKGKAKEVEDGIKAEHAHAVATPHYKEAEKAFGGDPAVFERIASQLIADGTVFAATFAKKELLAWNNQFFKAIGEEMRKNPGKPVGSMLFHRNMYGDVTHISAVFISVQGAVVIGHHESIEVGKPAMVDGLATGTVGCVSATFYTLQLHNLVRKMFDLDPITEDKLPALKSLVQTGPPLAHTFPIENYEAVEAFILRSACQSLTKFGLTVPYGVDPNPTLIKAGKDGAAGKLLTPPQARLLSANKHFSTHPKTHPPGGSGPFAPGEATNNCARFVFLCMHAAEAPAVAGMPYNSAMDLADVTQCLFDAGLLPHTDPKVVDLMRKGGYAKDSQTGLVTRHPVAFLTLAYGWSLALPNTAGAYAAHVDRVKMPDQDKLDTKLKDSWSKVLVTVQKNIDSFSTDVPAVHSALDLKMQLSPIHPLESDADWQDVAIHVNMLSKEDRETRFGVADSDAVIKSLRTARACDQHYYALRDSHSSAITLLLQIKLKSDGLNLNMEVGTSVVPDHRGKGLGRWGIAWACAWGRNRGATYFRGDYNRRTQEVTETLLKKLQLPLEFPAASSRPQRKEFSIALKPADHDTQWMEHFAQPLEFDRQAQAKKK
jgi:GNAT superfamily N-acetyltransferase